MTREGYIKEFYIREKNYKNNQWQEKIKKLEEKHVQNFITKEPPTLLFLEKLERCLIFQKWISAKSSAHQYILMKEFNDVDGIEFNDITSAIGDHGFFGYYWCDLYQYLIVGDFYYWSSLFPGAWGLINRARVDTPPKEAYFSNFQGEWAIVGEPNIKSWPYPCNPFNGKILDKNPFNGGPIREFNVNPEHFKFDIPKRNNV